MIVSWFVCVWWMVLIMIMVSSGRNRVSFVLCMNVLMDFIDWLKKVKFVYILLKENYCINFFMFKLILIYILRGKFVLKVIVKILFKKEW